MKTPNDGIVESYSQRDFYEKFMLIPKPARLTFLGVRGCLLGILEFLNLEFLMKIQL